MGTSCRIVLPSDVLIRDVADVMGILAGLPKHMDTLDNSGRQFQVCKVNGVKVKNTTIPEMGQIILEGAMVDGQKAHQVYYHYEGEHGTTRTLSPQSTALWIAIGRGLVYFFGGTMDYQDCDSVRVNFRKPKPRKWNDPESNKPYDDFQRAMFAVEPLTKADLNACKKWAAYN